MGGVCRREQLEYAGGRQQHQLVLDKGDARALCECVGRVFGALLDGSLLEWNVLTLEELRRLPGWEREIHDSMR